MVRAAGRVSWPGEISAPAWPLICPPVAFEPPRDGRESAPARPMIQTWNDRYFFTILKMPLGPTTQPAFAPGASTEDNATVFPAMLASMRWNA